MKYFTIKAVFKSLPSEDGLSNLKYTSIHPDGAGFVFSSELRVPGRCSRRVPAPGKRLSQATPAVRDIWKFQLIKQSSAPPRPDSGPVAPFDAVPLVS